MKSKKNNKPWLRWLANFSLLIIALVWGLTFVTVKNAINILPPYSFNFLRFTMASLVMLAFALPYRKKCSWKTIKAGLLIGVFLFSGYTFQTIGLLYTSASNAGFITGLSVVLVPLMVTVSSRELPRLGVLLGVISATIGLGLLTINESLSFNNGDVLIFFCAVSFALHIILVGKYALEHSTVWLVTWQIAAVAFLSGAFAFITEPKTMTLTPEVWQALVITALFATCMAFFLQNYMQRFTTACHTAIIFSTEPVFAAFFAVLLLQEILSVKAYWGGAFILAGMLLAELKSPSVAKNNNAFSSANHK